MRALKPVSTYLPILTLAACAGPGAPPAIAYDTADFKAAVPQPSPATPSPAPKRADPTRAAPTGSSPAAATPAAASALEPPKVMTLNAAQSRRPPRPPAAASPARRVAAANRAALEEPTDHGYLNAVQVYPYADGALYRLYAAPQAVTDIALQAGETLTSVSAGDTVRWIVGDTTSGVGEAKQVHVLVKPTGPGLRTNLVVMTDRRSYHLSLESTEHTFMAVIAWSYPQDQLFALQRQAKAAEDAQPISDGVALETLKFRYAITGDTPSWRPVRAFDDGTKVYIEFPDRIDQGEAPPLFVVGPAGDSQLVNYRVKRNYYIVDRLFAAAELRLGQKPQQIVRITRSEPLDSKDPGSRPDARSASRGATGL